MSRIGKLPIVIPEGVTVTVANNVATVKGKLGTLSQSYHKDILVKVEPTVAHITIIGSEVEGFEPTKEQNSMHGLYRMLIFNMVQGVTKGYQKSLIVNGVGYKVAKNGKKIVINCGYSHPVEVIEEDGITLELPTPNEIVVKGIDKNKVGQVAANIKAIKKPDPYHIYGIRYKDEVIVKKEGKTAGK